MNTDLITALTAAVGAAHVRSDRDSLMVYGRDRNTLWTPAPAAVVLPATIAEVQAVVRLANECNLAIVPSGGRTGLSGGAVAANGEVVLSLERMNRILAIDPVDRTLRCEAGAVTARVQQAAAEAGLFYPVDFASSGSSHIGGNVATNAGGIRVLRYGSTREQVLGLKVVTGAGDLLDLNRGLIKNNCGPDLRHLFIASEGILGVICEATLKLRTPPAPQQVMVVGARCCTHLLQVQAEARRRFALSAFEFFSQQALVRVMEHSGLAAPMAADLPFYGLLEFDQPSGGEADVLDFFAHCRARGWLDDGVIAGSERQARQLWRLREDISESLAAAKPIKHDIAVTLSRMPDFIRAMEALLAKVCPGLESIWFGHLGDGNIHLNVLPPVNASDEDIATLAPDVTARVLATVADFGGSISAEHGIGLLKKDYLHYSLSGAELTHLRQLKCLFDPKGVMNPGKVLISG